MQLDLWPAWVGRLPWGGQSPRALTRGAEVLFLRREPQKDARSAVDIFQVDMFSADRKVPFVYEGAPLLGRGI